MVVPLSSRSWGELVNSEKPGLQLWNRLSESCSLDKVKGEAEMEVDSIPVPASPKYYGYQGGPQSLGQLEDLS